MVWPARLQDQEELLVPAGTQELPAQPLSHLRDCPSRLPLLLPRHLHCLEGAEHQVPLVAAGPPLLPSHLVLRRGQEIRHEEPSSWQLGGERDLLLSTEQ